ncbi:MAG: nucleotidyltransferase domain-containing protein [Kofleriaceae bacterium]
MMRSWDVLTVTQQAVARTFIAEREAERRHLVVYLSGAHGYGFPSPDSDLDLKCIHIAPTGTLVGLDPPSEPDDRIEVRDGVELDYGSNELGPVLRGVLKGNGNYLERILGTLALGGDLALLATLRPLVQATLSRRVGKHYGGFATSQLRAFDDKPTAKRALYVLRTAATGRCLLERGVLETDVARLADFIPSEIAELMAIKRVGERQVLEPAHAVAWRARLAAAIEAATSAWPSSLLPVDPPPDAVAALDTWLRQLRRASWD